LPITTVGICGSVRAVTEAGSGTVLIPPSLTFNLYVDGQHLTKSGVKLDDFKLMFAKYCCLGREHLMDFMH